MTIAGNSARPLRPLLTGGEKLREILDAPPQGGGAKTYPVAFDEASAILQPQVSAAQQASAALPDRFKGKHVIYEATLRPEFLANSYFPADLLKKVGFTAVGSRFGETLRHATKTRDADPRATTKTLFLAGDEANLAALSSLLAKDSGLLTESVRHAVQAIAAIDLSVSSSTRSAVAATTESELVTWESVLHPEPKFRGEVGLASKRTRSKWADLVNELGGHVEDDWIRTSGDFTYIPVGLTVEALEAARAFNSLRTIAPMPRARHVEHVKELDVAQLLVAPAQDNEPSRPLRVAVFDGGVDDASPYWAGRVRELTLGDIDESESADDHGALVTSALLYGPSPSDPLTPANVAIDHYRVWPQRGRDDFQMYWLLDMINEHVRANDYQVVVISTAPQRFIEDDYVDRWTHELDQLAHDSGVLFVTAAGNNGEQHHASGQDGILLPGDMVNGMTIGASSSRAPLPSRAPFSALGPGRAGGRVRPDGIAFGGTDDEGFVFLRNDGTLAVSSGTSASAPNFVHGLSDLANRIGTRRVSPVTLRAFGAHFAQKTARGQAIEGVGHGALRSDWNFISDEAPNIAHVLYESTISRDEFFPLLLPVPDSATSDAISLRYTLVTSTSVDPKDPVEYTKAGLTIRLRPDSNRFTFSKPGAREVTKHLHRDRDEITALIKNGFTAASDPKTLSLQTRGTSEFSLREEGKWDTLRSFSRKFQAGNLFRPRVEITYLAREEGLLVNDVPDLSWALLVSLEGPANVEMHDLVRSQFPVLVPLSVPAAAVPSSAR